MRIQVVATSLNIFIKRPHKMAVSGIMAFSRKANNLLYQSAEKNAAKYLPMAKLEKHNCLIYCNVDFHRALVSQL